MTIKEWIIATDAYDSTPYECPYCGARTELQRNVCPYCKEIVKIVPYEVDDSHIEYERIVEQLVKLP